VGPDLKLSLVRKGSIGAVIAAGVLAACLGLVPIAAGVGPSPLRPLPVLISARGETVQGAALTYCVRAVPRPGTDDDNGECGDASEPTGPPRERLAVRPRDLVLLRFQDNPEVQDEVGSVRVAVTRIDAEGRTPLATVRARRMRGTPNRWRFRLPAQLRGANAFDVRVGFGTPPTGGSSDYLGGLQALAPR